MIHLYVVTKEVNDPLITIVGFSHLNEVDMYAFIWFYGSGSWSAGDDFMCLTYAAYFAFDCHGTFG